MRDVPRREILTKGAAALAGLAAVATVRSAFSDVARAEETVVAPISTGKDRPLKRYVIERDVPNIGKKTAQEYCEIARTSDKALAQLAPAIQWEHSYIADNKTFCIYLSEDEAAIRRHAEISGFPATRITEIDCILDPTSANSKA
jgi:hypothetical protein